MVNPAKIIKGVGTLVKNNTINVMKISIICLRNGIGSNKYNVAAITNPELTALIPSKDALITLYPFNVFPKLRDEENQKSTR